MYNRNMNSGANATDGGAMVKIVRHSDKEDHVIIGQSATAPCSVCERQTARAELKQHYGLCAQCERNEEQEHDQ